MNKKETGSAYYKNKESKLRDWTITLIFACGIIQFLIDILEFISYLLNNIESGEKRLFFYL